MTALPHPAPPQVRAGAKETRIGGVDMARALAILGMVAVHFGPYSPDTSTLLGWIYRSTYGRASVLFVLLAGVGVALLFRARPADQARIQIAWRVIVFFPLGVALQALPTPVAVILQFYAMYYLLGGLVGTVPTKVLAPMTLLWTAIGPIWFLTVNDPSLAGRGTATTVSEPMQVLTDLLVDGFYPLITWAPPLLVGVLIGRSDLRDTTTRVALTAGGLVTAAASYGGSLVARQVAPPEIASSPFLLSEGHTGAPLNVVGATGVAVAVLGLCLLLVSALPRVTWPWVAAGQMALTIYVGHLLVLAAVPELLEARDSVIAAVGKVSRFYVVVLVACTLWRLRFRRGPLEAMLTLPFKRSHPDPAPSDGYRRRQPDLTEETTGWESRSQRSWVQTSPELPSKLAPTPSLRSTSTSTSRSGMPPPND